MGNLRKVGKALSQNEVTKPRYNPKECNSIYKLVSIFLNKKKSSNKQKRDKNKENKDTNNDNNGTELQQMKKPELKSDDNVPMIISKEPDEKKEVPVCNGLLGNISGEIITTPLRQRGRGKVLLPIAKPAQPSAQGEGNYLGGRGRGLDLYRRSHIKPGTFPQLSDTEIDENNSTRNGKYLFIVKKATSPAKQTSSDLNTKNLKQSDKSPRFIYDLRSPRFFKSYNSPTKSPLYKTQERISLSRK